MIFETGRDGTVLTYLAAKNIEVGSGRKGQRMKIIVAWMGRDGTVWLIFLDATGR